MHTRLWRTLAAAVIFVMIVSTACSFSGGTATPAAQNTPVPVEPTKEVVVEPTKEAVPTEAPAPEGLITNLDDVQQAVIQIQAEGTFQDPEVGLVVNGAGRGSGFIIDPSGIAVTNNHVVTGAALIKVWIGGDTRKTYNAKVLGVSECSDLAVIDIEGDGFPYLAWHETDPKVRLKVYTAGFPLGEPEFTMTEGIISKASTSGETSWASVDNVVMHDAIINPGNSGGPLLDEDGKVVGVNYAGNNANQYFAISYNEAQRILDDLVARKDVTSIGVNGQAVLSEDGSISGIWVSSVDSGSEADKAGVQPGDIITQLEGLVLATDGTMADYCDVLRSHNPGDTLNITVLRWMDMQLLEGQLNGRELDVSVDLGSQVSNDAQTTTETGTGYSGYSMMQNDSGDIQMEIPNEWADFDGSDWSDTWTLSNGQVREFNAWSIAASADLDGYFNGYDESGVFFAASTDLGAIGGYKQLLYDTRGWHEDTCELSVNSEAYADELYEGVYDLWENCGANDTAVIVLSARPSYAPTNFLIIVEMKITQEADFDALDKILSTFQVLD
jgi:serine protease Do